jgi:hypothetical protein
VFLRAHQVAVLTVSTLSAIAQRQFGSALKAVRSGFVFCGWRDAPQNVFFACHGFDVRTPYALAISAKMVVLFPLGYLSDLKRVSVYVRLTGYTFIVKATISGRAYISNPFPALAQVRPSFWNWSILVGVCPKILLWTDSFIILVWHRSVLLWRAFCLSVGEFVGTARPLTLYCLYHCTDSVKSVKYNNLFQPLTYHV